MAMEPTTTTRTRRAVIGAALGGAAAIAAQSIAPLTARAAPPLPVVLGAPNTATVVTSVENTTAAEVSLEGLHSAAGTGVVGSSLTGMGIKGVSTDTTATDWTNPPPDQHGSGVYGVSGDGVGSSSNTNETGVYGFGNNSTASTGVWGDSAQGYGVYGSSSTGDGVYGVSGSESGVYGSGFFGVYGYPGSAGGAGVLGQADPTDVGLYGWTGDPKVGPGVPPVGVGVYAAAQTTALTALAVSGKVKFSRSGRKAMTSKLVSINVPLAGVTKASYVIATLQTSVTGCYVRAVVPATGSFTIYLSKAPGKTVYIGYMVIN